jgi:hypothetical protein
MPRDNTKMLGITAHFRRQDGKSADPPPPKFDRSGYTYGRTLSGRQLDHTRKTLEGDPDSLMAAFTWRHTPQGHDHWYEIQRGRTELLPEDRDYLEWLLEEYS